MATRVDLVTGDARTTEYNVWSGWMERAATLIDRHQDLWDDDDPFAYNETASVALLAAAGSLAGHVTLAEYCTQKLEPKKDKTKARRRKRHGRGDLWLHTDRRHWAFEFKQRMSVGVSRANGRLLSLTNQARRCAAEVIEKEDGRPVAGVVVSLYWIDDDDVAKRAADEIEEFARNNVAFCWRLSPSKNRRQTYLLFDPL